MPYTVCCDIGATKINTGLIRNNRVVISHRVETKKGKGLNSLLTNLKKSLTMYRPEKSRAISLSFAGVVDDGVIINATNFPSYIINLNLRKIIQKWFGKPVFIEHDGLCFTLAESILGQAKNFRHVIGLTIGTGVGGGLSVDKKIYRGGRYSMEMGHFKILEKGFRCSCGHFGHFESQVSGPALSKYYQKITGKYLKGEEINKRALKGDKAALTAAKIMAHYLGISLASLANTLSPDVFVLGGGVANFGEIITFSKNEMRKEVIYPQHKKIKIIASHLGNHAQLLGASLLTVKNYYLD